VKPRSLAILTGVLGLLVLAIVLLGRKEEAVLTSSAELLFPGFDATKATKIAVKTKDKDVALEKKDGVWVIAGEGFKADEEAVKNLLDRVKEVEVADVASTNPESAKLFEVDKGGEHTVEVQLSAGATSLAHFFVGKSGPDFSSNYVRLDGSDRAVRAASRMREAFDRGARGWRDRVIFNILPDNVAAVSLTSPELTAELVAAGDGDKRTWTLSLAGTTSPADTDAARGMVETLATLHTDDFAAATVSVADAALEPPSRTAVMKLKDGSSHTLDFGKDSEDGRVYVRADALPTIYLLGKYRINQVFKKSEDLKPKPTPTPEPSPAPTAP